MTDASRLPPAPRPESNAARLPALPFETVDVLAFGLDTEAYALPLGEVREILKVPAITEVPRADPDVLGILSLRGTVVTLVDLRRRIGLPCRPFDRRTRVLVVQRGEEPIGLLVDAVTEVVRLRREEIEDKPSVPGTRHAEFFAGVARPSGALYVLLSLEAVLAGL